MGDLCIKMSKYGRTLTDRPDGQKTIKDILAKRDLPKTLDFSGVIALGSSFGDEVVPKLAFENNGVINVMNANKGIRSCLKKIAEDFQIEVKYV